MGGGPFSGSPWRLLAVGPARPEDDAAKTPQQPSDHFVFLTGPKKRGSGQRRQPSGRRPAVHAYPVSPDGTVRNETLLNLVILTRFDPAELSEETLGHGPPRAWSPTPRCARTRPAR